MPIRTVLFIDDDPSIQHFASKTADYMAYEFLFYERAVDALEFVEQETPDLVVIDLSMTDMAGDFDRKAGIEVTKSLRQRYGDLFPILVLTGNETPALISECLRAGADDYYVKSHEFSGLLRRIAAWLVVEYDNQSAVKVRTAVANALDKLVEQKALLTIKEWRRVAMHSIYKSEYGDLEFGQDNDRTTAPDQRPVAAIESTGAA